MRSLSWSNAGQGILALLAILVPAVMVAVVLTNMPVPQLSFGTVLRAIGRAEAAQGVPVPILSPLSFGLAGNGLEPLGRRFANPFGSLGHGSYMLIMLTMIAGIAAAPWLLPRITTTPGVYEARKSLGWAVVLLAIVMVTISAIAVFMRELVMDSLAGQNRAEHPEWFAALVKAGLADLDSRQTRPPLSAFSFHRDSALFMLPIAYGYPLVLLHLMLAGAAAAALAAAGNSSQALAHIVAEDVIGGLASTPVADRLRINIARVSLLLVTIVGVVIGSTVASDPLRLVLWAMAISASTAFPAAVLAIWWKRANALAIAAALVTGFVTSVGLLFAFEAAWFGVPSVFAGAFGMPAAFAAATIVTWTTPAPQRHVLETARDLRTPGGETLFDREIRLQRLKQRQAK
jgi:cation/acetate symporter